MRINKIITILLLLNGAVLSQTDPNISQLRGLEDVEGSTILFYRFGDSGYFDFNVKIYDDVHSFNTQVNTDTCIFDSYVFVNQYGSTSKLFCDYFFLNNNINQFITAAVYIDVDAAVVINNSLSGTTFENTAGTYYKIFSTNINTVIYIASDLHLLKSNDNGTSWTTVQTNLPFDIISINPFNEMIFASNNQGSLYFSDDNGTSFQLIMNSNEWNYFAEFYYDTDEIHSYAVTYENSESALYVTYNPTESASWNKIATSSKPIICELNNYASGEIYYSNSAAIYKSEDYGQNFDIYMVLPKTITGMYKKPNSDVLFASSAKKIYRTTDASCDSVFQIFPSESLKYYPLRIGNAFFYNCTSCVIPEHDCNTRKYSRTVTGIKVKPNGEKYFEIQECYESSANVDYVYERIDSLSGKIYRYSEIADTFNNEIVLDDLSAIEGDQITGGRFGVEDYLLYPFLSTYILDIEPFLLWNSNTYIKHCQIAEPTFLSTYSFVKNFGLYSRNESADWYSLSQTLCGAVINGVAYGDTTTITSIEQHTNSIYDFNLFQNYPNPFNPTTQITFELYESCLVNIVVYDILGNRISTLENKNFLPGTYTTIFKAHNLASGIYYCRLVAKPAAANRNTFSKSIKMILIK